MTNETRSKIDFHLETVAGYNAHLGKDSTRTERLTATVLINREMEAIKLLDLEFWRVLNPDGRSNK